MCGVVERGETGWGRLYWLHSRVYLPAYPDLFPYLFFFGLLTLTIEFLFSLYGYTSECECHFCVLVCSFGNLQPGKIQHAFAFVYGMSAILGNCYQQCSTAFITPYNAEMVKVKTRWRCVKINGHTGKFSESDWVKSALLIKAIRV